MTTITLLLKRIEEVFADRLSAKTGWGRNEILAAYKDSVNTAVIEALQKEEKP